MIYYSSFWLHSVQSKDIILLLPDKGFSVMTTQFAVSLSIVALEEKIMITIDQDYSCTLSDLKNGIKIGRAHV